MVWLWNWNKVSTVSTEAYQRTKIKKYFSLIQWHSIYKKIEQKYINVLFRSLILTAQSNKKMTKTLRHDNTPSFTTNLQKKMYIAMAPDRFSIWLFFQIWIGQWKINILWPQRGKIKIIEWTKCCTKMTISQMFYTLDTWGKKPEYVQSIQINPKELTAYFHELYSGETRT